MATLGALLDRLESLVTEVDALPDDARATVAELLDGLDALHRLALHDLAGGVGAEAIRRAREEEPTVDWLCTTYGVGVDERSAAEAALETVRPYVHSHGGRVELVDVSGGRVRLRMSGACAGCTSSAITLSQGIEEALREHLPGFVAVDVEEEPGAEAHPPPGETLVQIGSPPPT